MLNQHSLHAPQHVLGTTVSYWINNKLGPTSLLLLHVIIFDSAYFCMGKLTFIIPLRPVNCAWYWAKKTVHYKLFKSKPSYCICKKKRLACIQNSSWSEYFWEDLQAQTFSTQVFVFCWNPVMFSSCETYSLLCLSSPGIMHLQLVCEPGESQELLFIIISRRHQEIQDV